MTTVYSVYKNSDFTEGRGPMVYHSTYATLELAHDFVQGQNGIFGSPQHEKPTQYTDGKWGYNGYEIQEQFINGLAVSDTNAQTYIAVYCKHTVIGFDSDGVAQVNKSVAINDIPNDALVMSLAAWERDIDKHELPLSDFTFFRVERIAKYVLS